ncbi:MAG: hypothetical protein AAF206_30520 [Bacteroidota bacterium]
MKTLFLLLLAIGIWFPKLSGQHHLDQLQIADSLIQLNNNPSSWDQQLFAQDLKDWKAWRDKRLPLNQLPSPVPSYRNKGTGYRIGSYLDGAYESISFWVKSPGSDTSRTIADQELVCSLVVRKGKYKAGEVISRNAPHYLAQGRFNGGRKKIDWVAVDDEFGASIVMINGRYFNLKGGRVIMIYLLKDHSMRFYQTDYPVQVNSKTVNEGIKQTISSKKVRQFETQIGK